MSLIINWKAVTGASKYRIYRSTTKFVNTTLPSDVTEVDSTVLTKEYTDAVRNVTYWFAISSVDADGNETLGNIFPVGYFPESGPGPITLLRGDWSFGVFGEVPAADVITSGVLQSAINAAGATATANSTAITKYIKCVVNGRILFIPDAHVNQASSVAANNAVDNMKLFGFSATVGASPVINSNGWDYQYRLPHASTIENKYNTAYAPNVNADEYLNSEASLMAGLFLNISNNPTWPLGLGDNPTTKYHLGDLTWNSFMFVAALDATAGSKGYYYMQANGSITTGTGMTMRGWPVLELLL